MSSIEHETMLSIFFYTCSYKLVFGSLNCGTSISQSKMNALLLKQSEVARESFLERYLAERISDFQTYETYLR